MKHLKNLNKTTSPNTTINEGLTKISGLNKMRQESSLNLLDLTLPISYVCHSVLEAESAFQVPPDRSNS